MLYFTKQNIITLLQRPTYTSGKSAFATISGNYSGYLRPLSEEISAVNGIQWGQGFQLITESGVDIRTGDRVTISSTVYTIRGAADHNRGGFTAYKKFLLVLTEA